MLMIETIRARIATLAATTEPHACHRSAHVAARCGCGPERPALFRATRDCEPFLDFFPTLGPSREFSNRSPVRLVSVCDVCSSATDRGGIGPDGCRRYQALAIDHARVRRWGFSIGLCPARLPAAQRSPGDSCHTVRSGCLSRDAGDMSWGRCGSRRWC